LTQEHLAEKAELNSRTFQKIGAGALNVLVTTLIPIMKGAEMRLGSSLRWQPYGCLQRNTVPIDIRVRQTWGKRMPGHLHYHLVEAEFPGDAPSLPTRMRVTAFPRNDFTDIVGDKK
jgi:hypothetical protein